MIRILLSYLVFFPSTILCYFPMYGHLRYSLRRTVLMVSSALIGISLLSATAEYVFGLDENLVLVPLFLVFFFAYYHSLDVHISKALAVFCTSISLVSILTNLAICLVDLGGRTADLELRESYVSLLQFVLCTAALVPLGFLYRKYGKNLIDQTEESTAWYVIPLISAAFFAINMFLLPIEASLIVDRDLLLHVLLILVFLLILWLASQVVAYLIVSGISERYRTRERIRILELEEAQFAAQQQYMKASEKTRHDFRQSIRTLSGLYNEGNYPELGEYLRQYIGQMPTNEFARFCENSALNALLNYYAHITAANQIEFVLRVSLPEEIPVSDVDLCNIVGNILDNAVAACQKADEKKIQLSIIAEDGIQLYIVAVNSSDGKTRQKNGPLSSDSSRRQGIGLSSIRSIAEAYGGLAQFSVEDNRFYSNIAIPLNPEQAEP